MRKEYQVTSSAMVKAPAEVVYQILADYRDGHPHILLRKYFTSFEIEQGGRGSGIIHLCSCGTRRLSNHSFEPLSS